MLTDLAIRSLPVPDKGVKRYWDKDGLCIQVSQGGTKTFYFVQGENRRFIKLGRYPQPLSLSDARERVRTIIAKKTLGLTDEAVDQKMQDAIDRYLSTYCTANKPRTLQEKRRVFAYLKPLGKRRIGEVGTRELLTLIEKASNSSSERHHIYAAARAFFRWTVRERYIKTSPLQDVHPPGKKSDSRDRVLSDEEMAKIYKAACVLQERNDPYGFICLIAIHTGMRRGEAGGLRWSYITDETITLPPTLTKNKREHTLPNLLGANLALVPRTLETVLDKNGDLIERPCDLLFPSSAMTPYSTWSDGKETLDALCKVEGFVFHDFRRYLSTTMARLRVPIDVTEMILNHVTGSRSPIQRVYDRYDRLPEMRDTLLLYEKHLAALISSD